MPDKRYVPFKGKVIELVQRQDGFFYDDTGCIWGFSDPKTSVDPISRCGVGIISLPEKHPLNDGCKVHDYLYSCPIWQAFHTRKEADKWLLNSLKIVAKDKWYSVLAKPFYIASRWFGSKYWDRPETND